MWSDNWGGSYETYTGADVDGLGKGKGGGKYGKALGKGGRNFGGYLRGKGGKGPQSGGKGGYTYGYGGNWPKGANPKGTPKGNPKGGGLSAGTPKPRTAKGEAIYMGYCHVCGEQGHSAKFCPVTHPVGTPGVHHGKCPKCGARGHTAEFCPKQVRNVGNVGEGTDKEEVGEPEVENKEGEANSVNTSGEPWKEWGQCDNECWYMGYVQHVSNVEVHNSFSALDEDEGWTEIVKTKRRNKMKQVPKKRWKPIDTKE